MASDVGANSLLLAAELRAKRTQILPVCVLEFGKGVLKVGFVAFAPATVPAMRCRRADGPFGIAAQLRFQRCQAFPHGISCDEHALVFG